MGRPCKFVLILALCLITGLVSADKLKRKNVNEYTEEPDYYLDLLNIDDHLLPDETCTYDLGSSTLKWKDAYFNGTLNADGGNIFSSTGAISFGDEDLITTGTLTSNDHDILDETPHLTFVDTDDAPDIGYMWHLDTASANAPWQNYGLWRGTYAGGAFSVTPNKPLMYFDDNDNVDFPVGLLKTKGDIVYHGVSFILDGMAEDRQDLFLTTSGGNVFFETEKIGGGDIEYIFDELEYDLDCTTGAGTGGRAQVQLTEGTSITVTRNYIYVDLVGSTATLKASTSLPSGEFAWVAIVAILTDTEVDADGALVFQRFSETLKHDETPERDRGALSYQREKLRWLGAQYLTGVAQTLTITANGGSADNVVLTTALGKVFQLHRQDWPAYDISTDGIWVANASGSGTLTNYQKLTDLNSILETSDGTAITNNKRFNLIIWGSINFSTGDCKIFVNLPTDTYAKDDQAIADRDNTAVTTIPEEFQTTGFLIARLPFKYQTANSGTWTNLMGGTAVIDLRGIPPGFNKGTGGGIATNSFNDDDFNVFDGTDSTKIMKFQVSGVSTGTTRTLTVPDLSATIAVTGSSQDWLTTGTLGSNDIEIKDDTPHLRFWDTDNNITYEWHLDPEDNPWQNFGLWRGVSGDVSPNTPLLYFDNNNTTHFPTGDIRIDSDSSVLDLGNTTGDYTIGWDGSDAVHTITAGDFVFTGGKVGIGTATPSYILHAKFAGQNYITMETVSGTGLAGLAIMAPSGVFGELVMGGTAYGGVLFGNSRAGALSFNTSNDSDITSMMFGTLTNAPLIFGTSNTERMRIVGASGNVLIPSDSAILGFGANALTAPDATIGFDGDSLNIIANAVTATDDLNITAHTVGLTNTLQILSDTFSAPTSGKGFELRFNSGIDRGQLICYDRDTSAYKTFGMDGAEIRFDISGVNKGVMQSSLFYWNDESRWDNTLWIDSPNVELKVDSGKYYCGVANDASIEFDGDSMNVVANAVTGTDDLEITADDVLITGDVGIADTNPHITLRVTEDDSAFNFHANMDGENDPWGVFQLWKGSDTDGKSFGVNPNKPIWYVDSSNNMQFPLADIVIDSLSLSGASITDSTGTISFGNENLTTTGTISNNADNSKHAFGLAGTADSYIQWDGTALDFYSSGATYDFNSGTNRIKHNFITTAADGIFEWFGDQDYFVFQDTVYMVGNLQVGGATEYLSGGFESVSLWSAGTVNLNATSYINLVADTNINGYSLYFDTGNTIGISSDETDLFFAGAEEYNFDGNVFIFGSLTYDTDDPIVGTFYPTTRAYALQLVKESTPSDKIGGISLYFNKDTKQFESYSHIDGKIFKVMMEEIAQVEPLVPDLSKEEARYRFNPQTGNVDTRQTIRKSKSYRLKKNVTLDPSTGKFIEEYTDENGEKQTREITKEEAVKEID